MSQPWHTEGYLILASALVYLVVQRRHASEVEQGDFNDAMAVIRDAGKQIRREHESLS